MELSKWTVSDCSWEWLPDKKKRARLTIDQHPNVIVRCTADASCQIAKFQSSPLPWTVYCVFSIIRCSEQSLWRVSSIRLINEQTEKAKM